MTHPYDTSRSPSRHRTAQHARQGGAARPVLWVLLAISATGNMVVSTAGLSVIGNILFGVVTVACAAALIVQHYRGRPR